MLLLYNIRGVFSYWKDKHQLDFLLLDFLQGIVTAIVYLVPITDSLTLILRRSRTGTVWFYTSTSNKRTARPKLYTKSLTTDLKRMYSRLTLVRISNNL